MRIISGSTGKRQVLAFFCRNRRAGNQRLISWRIKPAATRVNAARFQFARLTITGASMTIIELWFAYIYELLREISREAFYSTAVGDWVYVALAPSARAAFGAIEIAVNILRHAVASDARR